MCSALSSVRQVAKWRSRSRLNTRRACSADVRSVRVSDTSLLRRFDARLRIDDVMVELLDDVADRLELTDRRLARVRGAQRLRAALLNGLQRLLRDARLVRRALRLGQLGRDLLLRLLAELEHLLEPKLESAHDDLPRRPCRSAARSTGARVFDASNAVLSSGSCCRNSSTCGRSRSAASTPRSLPS